VFSNNQQAREVVLEGCASLVAVVVASCSRLGSLVLSPPSSRGSDGGVERLVIEGCAALTRVALPPGTSRRLRLVSVSLCGGLTSIDPVGGDWSRLWVFSAVHSTDLRLPVTTPAGAAGAADAASEWRAPNLIALHLPRNKIGGNNEVRLVAPRLRTLSADYSAIGDGFLARMAAPLDALESVSLAGCGGVTPAGVAQLLAKAPRLTSLDLSGCSGLTMAQLALVLGARNSGNPSSGRQLRVRLAGGVVAAVDQGEMRQRLAKQRVNLAFV
jgi:hypothetical protein